jgi:septal ring factor EnvC (AmiA/AmiB activator)
MKLRNKIYCLKLLFLFCTFFPTVEVLAEDEKLKLDELRTQMSESESQVSSITEELKSIKAEVQKLSSQVSVLKDREKKLRKDLDKKQSSQLEIQKLVQDLQGRLLELEIRSTARVKALYLLHVSDLPATRAFVSNGYEAFSRGSVYLKSIKKMDAQEAEEVRALRGRRDVETGKLQKTLQESQNLLAEVTLQRKEIEAKIDTQNEKVSEFKIKKKSLETALVSLRAQELRFETVLKSMTGGDKEVSLLNSNDVQDRENAPWEGPGLKGELFNPLKGKVTKKFGVGSGVTKKGILIQGSSLEVIAAAEGKVAFIGVLPQLGTVVILDHGDREFSLYGKLSDAHVSVGAIVPAGAPVGFITKDTFYFEIRKKGVSTDPLLNRYASR